MVPALPLTQRGCRGCSGVAGGPTSPWSQLSLAAPCRAAVISVRSHRFLTAHTSLAARHTFQLIDRLSPLPLVGSPRLPLLAGCGRKLLIPPSDSPASFPPPACPFLNSLALRPSSSTDGVVTSPSSGRDLLAQECLCAPTRNPRPGRGGR